MKASSLDLRQNMLRAAAARTREAHETATAADAWNWFKHCGYAPL